MQPRNRPMIDKNNRFQQVGSFHTKRTSIILDEDVAKNLRLHQAKLIRKNQKSYSFSKVINNVLRTSLGVKND